MNTALTQYFVKGFRLVNKSFDLLLIQIVLSSAVTYGNLLGPWAAIVSLVLIVFMASFLFSLPVFLEDKQQSARLNYKAVWQVVLQNSKRVILPGLALVVIFFAVMVVLNLLFFRSGNFSASNPLLTVLFNVVAGFSIFTAFFFSLEKVGLLTAIVKSLKVATKHMAFVALVIVVSTVASLLSLLLVGLPLAGLIALVITSYVNLVVLAATLYYYQAHIAKK